MKQDYYYKFCGNLFVDATVVSDFSDYCCSSLENKNTLAIDRRKQFTEAATGCLKVYFKFAFGNYYPNHLKMSVKE